MSYFPLHVTVAHVGRWKHSQQGGLVGSDAQVEFSNGASFRAERMEHEVSVE